jgi:phenylalanyl-tRNA synthetase beta chain
VTWEAPDWFHPGRSGALKLGPKTTLGVFGEFHPDLLAALKVDQPIAGFELYLNALPQVKRKGTAKPALEASNLQPVKRDFAFVVDQAVANDVIIQAASRSDNLIVDVDTFDVFTGTGVPEGMKSIAIEVLLQPRDKTLTDSEIDAVAEKVIEAVVKATGARLRG